MTNNYYYKNRQQRIEYQRNYRNKQKLISKEKPKKYKKKIKEKTKITIKKIIITFD